MPIKFGDDSWNKHKWPREKSWWDDLEVDRKAIKEDFSSVFDWLESVAPDPFEHDYVLHTDGSGCVNGWGGYAALWQRIEREGELRQPVDSDVLVSGTYGSTVQRCEMNALIDAVQRILTERCAELKEQARAVKDDALLFKLGSEGLLNQFVGDDRLSILWYTDRSNVAQSLLFDENGDVLSPRDKERDLWLRWSLLAKHVCITPMCLPRNVVEGQAVCDELAGIARGAMKASLEAFAKSTEKFHPTDKWQTKKPQKVRF